MGVILMFSLFGKRYKARRLDRDCRAIIRSDELAYRPSHLEQIGALVTEYLEQARKTGSTEPIDPPNWLKNVHREARKKHDQARLSAATLAIIYLRAQKLEEDGVPVCQNIDSYLLKWQSEPSLSGTAEIDRETPP
jgi:hypothetical protein